MAKRKALSVRVRFEILKRDGFRCRYCGAGAVDEPLEIDHVVPVVDGGSNDPANLVAACWSCNHGKQARGLEESSLPTPIPAEALHMQAAQIRSYLAAQQEVVAARDELNRWAIERWAHWFDELPPADWHRKSRSILSRHRLDEIDRAMEATRGASGVHGSLSRWRYFQAVLRCMREQAAAEAERETA